jgi:hypothetical protein
MAFAVVIDGIHEKRMRKRGAAAPGEASRTTSTTYDRLDQLPAQRLKSL